MELDKGADLFLKEISERKSQGRIHFWTCVCGRKPWLMQDHSEAAGESGYLTINKLADLLFQPPRPFRVRGEPQQERPYGEDDDGKRQSDASAKQPYGVHD
jgi:hypothetical protein